MNPQTLTLKHSDKYRYQKFLSDIAGQDIKSHEATPESVIKSVRSFLANARSSDAPKVKGPDHILKRYQEFEATLSVAAGKLQQLPGELEFIELVRFMDEFIKLDAA